LSATPNGKDHPMSPRRTLTGRYRRSQPIGATNTLP
jgi:hypothetical protein